MQWVIGAYYTLIGIGRFMYEARLPPVMQPPFIRHDCGFWGKLWRVQLWPLVFALPDLYGIVQKHRAVRARDGAYPMSWLPLVMAFMEVPWLYFVFFPVTAFFLLLAMFISAVRGR